MAKYLEGYYPKNKTTVKITSGAAGSCELHIDKGFFSQTINLYEELKGTKLLTSETAQAFLDSEAWKPIGGALLGSAVVFAGEKSGTCVAACEMKSGEKFILSLSAKEYDYLIRHVPEQLSVTKKKAVFAASGESPAQAVKMLEALKQSGIITQEEFEARKEDLFKKK